MFTVKKKKKVKSVRFSRMNMAKLGLQQSNIVMSFSTLTIFLKVIVPIHTFQMNGAQKDSFIYKIRIKGKTKFSIGGLYMKKNI